MASVYWLMALVVLLVIEAATAGLATIWFAGGALIALILSLFHVSIWTQLTVFVVVSLILLVVTRPIALRYISRDTVATNVDSLIGTDAVVTEEINNLIGYGHVSHNGNPWTARAEDPGQIIAAGTVVQVVRVEGVKLIVRVKEEKN